MAAAEALAADTKRKCPSKACYCIVLTTWLTLAVIGLLTTSGIYVGPLVKSLRFVFTDCRIENSFYTTQFICRCGWGCKSSYPCMLIHVSFNTTDAEQWTVALYEDELQQADVVGEEDAQEWCSLKVCDPDFLMNHRVVDSFYSQYGERGGVVRCAYDPWEVRQGAVLTVTPINMAVFHALFWPLLAFITGVTLCVVFCRRCRVEDERKEGQDSALELVRVDRSKVADSASSSSGRAFWSGRFKKHKSASVPESQTSGVRKALSKSRTTEN